MLKAELKKMGEPACGKTECGLEYFFASSSCAFCLDLSREMGFMRISFGFGRVRALNPKP